jgi:hypothetical protein
MTVNPTSPDPGATAPGSVFVDVRQDRAYDRTMLFDSISHCGNSFCAKLLRDGGVSTQQGFYPNSERGPLNKADLLSNREWYVKLESCTIFG